ncbi:hypothetical protein OOK58_35395 [Streptomyces sp. NBC_01728]|uniref:hypothetical protein n=1 Tax=unclassified Streptomyces TaxID=2593676 RepID=UPI002256AC23|nr:MULTISPECIES: hypothetical protein [unclassified Streptomyces]MCX4457247.1 hypothetical protein [Streptomyces sp. NBC_01719]MCX4496604.1 hypothetical protein [Streptomyces sp. NBC_01728]
MIGIHPRPQLFAATLHKDAKQLVEQKWGEHYKEDEAGLEKAREKLEAESDERP